MKKDYTVLCIDDDKFIHKMISRVLADDYHVAFALDGAEGVEKAQELQPDVIITDVEMPAQNGYEVCDKIRNDSRTRDIPVVFLSSLDSAREKLMGYEAGGDDYLVKPFDADELKNKISVLIRFREEQLALRAKADEAQKTAFIAMAGSSELGQAMQLIEQSYCAMDYAMLANQFFAYAGLMGLNCSLLIMENHSAKCYSSKGMASPLETDLMNVLKGQDRFHDFGCRTQINYPNISLLIKNMPLDNMERYGRIKDLFPSILAAYDAKIRSLNVEKMINDQNLALNKSFQMIKETIGELSQSLRDNARSGFQVLDATLKELDLKLPGMGLEEDQEQFIISKIESAIEAIKDISDAGDNISASMQMVIEQLQILVKQQDELLESSTRLHQEQLVSNNSQEAMSMDIELF